MFIDTFYMDILDHVAPAYKGKETAQEARHAEWRCRTFNTCKTYCAGIQEERFVLLIYRSIPILIDSLFFIHARNRRQN